MNVPIKYCFLVKAADNAESFAELHPIMKRNLDGGHLSVMPCKHDPHCRDLTDAEYKDLMTRFKQPVDHRA